MRKKFTHGLSLAITALGLFASSTFAFAQESRTILEPAPTFHSSVEVAPGVTPASPSVLPTPPALWDVQFNYDATDSIPGKTGGMAAAVHIGTEFWISKWASDTLYRFDNTGKWLQTVLIPGLTGVRAMTWDGTYIYASNNTATVYRINPTTKVLAPPHITAPIASVRMCSYDSSAASGAGGFWIGNFGTDITLMGMTGTTLSTIPSATHGLTGMYGCAVDHFSTGGKFLWVFAQMAPSNMTLYRVALPGGTAGISHDVGTDAGTLTSGGLAGGLFISDAIVPGKVTLGGLLQGTPNRLFGYELGDPPPIDASLGGFRSVKGYTRIPLSQVTPIDFMGTIQNAGSSSITTPRLTVRVMSGASTIWTDSTTGSAIAPGASGNITVGSFTPPGLGYFEAWGRVRTPGQTDPISGNDTLLFAFEITDSTFGRDDDNPTATGYVVSGPGTWAYATANYDLPVADTITSVWVRLTNPTHGDSTYAVVAATTGGVPYSIIGTGNAVIIDSTINEYLLMFPGGFALAPGTYAIGCYEDFDGGINLSQSLNYYTAGTNYFFTTAGGWVASGINTARFIRPNFGDDFILSSGEKVDAKGISVFPNPTNGNVHVAFAFDQSQDVEITVTNVLGATITQRLVNDVQSRQLVLDLNNQPSGIYYVNFRMGDQMISRKIVLTK